MKIVSTPTEEKKILATVSPDTTAKEIQEMMAAKAESCVDHLCGCKK